MTRTEPVSVKVAFRERSRQTPPDISRACLVRRSTRRLVPSASFLARPDVLNVQMVPRQTAATPSAKHARATRVMPANVATGSTRQATRKRVLPARRANTWMSRLIETPPARCAISESIFPRAIGVRKNLTTNAFDGFIFPVNLPLPVISR